MMRYFCCDQRRREAVLEHGSLNGIEYLEVLDDPNLPDAQRQRTIFLHFLKNLSAALTEDNVHIEGGERVRNIAVTSVSSQAPDVLKIEVDTPGDFSTYTLRLVTDDKDPQPPAGFDTLLSAIDFSFKVACPSDFDCKAERICPPEPVQEPLIDYLAKDYASFRELMLDRMSLLMPQWKETSPADLSITMVELLAYVGDYLSYKQDAVATEAYLGTARRRVSVRRHAHLVDYEMHDGCNARAWVQVAVSAERVKLPKGTQFFTRVEGLDICIAPNSTTYTQALEQHPEVFESMHAAVLFDDHNRMSFYTWGDRSCCLPKGATRATLKGAFPQLKAGEVLIFLQQRDPETGTKGDADLRHRHAVRLTHVQVSEDPLGGRIVVEGQDDLPRPVTQIEWAQADALPFPFCVSSAVESGGEQNYTEDISLALGNVVLADHGRTLSVPEDLGTVPESKLEYAPTALASQDRCQPQKSRPVPPRYRPQLVEKPLTQAAPYELKEFFDLVFEAQHQQDLDAKILPEKLRQRFVDRGVRFDAQALSIQGIQDEWSLSDGNSAYLVRKQDQRLRVYQLPPAASAIDKWGPQDAKAAILLYSPSQGSPDAQEWKPMRHLLGSRASARQFVVEVETDAVAYLRFGDDTFGRRPEAGTSFEAVYRVGNGVRGNVGVESIHHITSVEKGAIECVWNPLPAQGGAEPEGMENVRQMAPYAFRRQERAVTPQDYAEVAARHAQVQRAAATVRWTGSWHTHYLTVDRLGGLPVDGPFKRELRRFLERYRLAGHDLEIEGPHYVPLEIEMEVCVMPEYFRSDVAQALLRIFSANILPSGERGVFHPDNFTFGQPVYLSQLYAAAEEVAGVASYEVTVFQRLGQPSRKALDEGKLVLGRLEVARLENDPNFPEHGVFRLKLEGGL